MFFRSWLKDKSMPIFVSREGRCKSTDKYMCIACNKNVYNNRAKIQSHANGRKHKKKMDLFVRSEDQQTSDIAKKIKDRFGVDFLVISEANARVLDKILGFFCSTTQGPVGLGFMLSGDKLIGISLTSEDLCINLDRTVLQDGPLITSSDNLRHIFEGPRVLGCGDMWELMIMLHDLYGYKCNAIEEVTIPALTNETAKGKRGSLILTRTWKLHWDHVCRTTLLQRRLSHLHMFNTKMGSKLHQTQY